MKKTIIIFLFLCCITLYSQQAGLIALSSITRMRPRPVVQNRTLVTGDTFKKMRGGAMPVWEEEAELAYSLDADNWIKARDLLNMNAIRVVNFDAYAKTHWGSSWDSSHVLDEIDKCVAIGEQVGMYVIINYHDFPYNEGSTTYTENQRWEMCKDFWVAGAQRWKDKTHVIFELTNEPYNDLAVLVDNIYRIADIYNTIKTTAPDTPIILVSPWSPGNLLDPNSRTMRQMANACGSFANWDKDVFGWHAYPGNPYEWDGDFQGSVADFLANSTIPHFCTEFMDATEDSQWNDPDFKSYYDHKIEVHALENEINVSWLDWMGVGRSDADFRKYGIRRLKADAVSNGYYWVPDVPGSGIP